MPNEFILVIKTSKSLPVNHKTSGAQPSSAGNSRVLITPLPASQQTKVVNRLISFFESK